MIIGLTGTAGSGKSTAASYLKNELGFVRINFKDALVEEMKERLPDILEQIRFWYKRLWLQGGFNSIDELFIDKPPLMRALMRNYGTEVRRGDDPNYWTKRWVASVLKQKEDQHIVVDDVRFINEAQTVRARGGTIVRIIREGHGTDSGHSSETEMTQILPDFTISVPDGNIDYLNRKMREIVGSI